MRFLLSLLVIAVCQSQLLAGFFEIPLEKAVNMGFRDPAADDKQGGWTDQGPDNDMAALPTGRREFGGVPFRVIDPERNGGRSCLALRSAAHRPYFPLESAVIEVNRRAATLHFLMGCGWTGKPDEVIAQFIVRYKDSSFYSEIPVVYGRHLGGWWSPQPVSVGEVAWKRSNGSADVGIYSFGWVNPYPEQEIRDIQLSVSGQTALPILIAVSGTDPDAAGQAIAAAIRQKELKASETEKIPDSAALTVDFTRPTGQEPAYSIAFGIGGNCLDDLFRKAAKNLIDAGTGRVLFRYQISTGVGKAEPALAEGVWDFSRLDRVVDYITGIGAEPMLCFGPGGPIWMAQMNNVYGDSKRYWRPADTGEYLDYCRRIVEHYRKRQIPVDWEFANEVELKRWPLSYFLDLYGRVAAAVRTIDPAMRVGGPGSCNPNLGWAEELLKRFGPEIGFVSYHEYGYSETFDTPDAYVLARTAKYETNAREYRKIMQRHLGARRVPLIITEANINWRWQGGTDPRIRNMAGAAWFASAQGRFWRGGGDAFCFFTFGGGFGCAYGVKGGKLALTPIYHALYLYRKYGGGKLVGTASSAATVEVYGFDRTGDFTAIIVNKNPTPVKIALTLRGVTRDAAVQSRLTAESAQAAALLEADRPAPALPAEPVTMASGAAFSLEPFEVRAISWKK